MASEPPKPLATPPFSVASPVSATAVGAVFGVGVTMMLKVSLAASPPESVAVTLTPSVPVVVGVPLKERVAERESEPGGQCGAIGGGCRVGESVAAIDVGKSARLQWQGEKRTDAGGLVGSLDREHGGVVGAVDGDGESMRVEVAPAVSRMV